MFPVADDFTAIARRLKEIEAEVAKERAAREPRHPAGDESDREADYVCGDMSVCG
jgi:hypothetical protein